MTAAEGSPTPGEPASAGEVVRRCFDAWHQGDLDALLDLYDPDVELDACAFGEGVYRGRTEVRRFLEVQLATTTGAASRRFDDLRLHEGADGRIAVTGTVVGTGAASGARISSSMGFVYEVRAGRVVRLVYHRHPDEALVSVGLAA